MGAMVTYAGLAKLVYEHFCKLRMGTHKLYDMVFAAFRTRFGNVYRHAFRSANIEMGYYVEYFFHHQNHAKVAINAQTATNLTLLTHV